MAENKKLNVPLHVGIIPDGNRRWAKLRGQIGSFGHKKALSADRLKELLNFAKGSGIKYLTLWGFSTENWKRDAIEKKVLFEIFEQVLLQIRDDSNFKDIKFVHFGRKDRLPKKIVDLIIELENRAVIGEDVFTIGLALDYGGKDEIMRACLKVNEKKLQFNEENLLANLDTGIKGIPDLDLIIRTSGEKRLSGFMPLQSCYAEIYFEEKMWPDFTEVEFEKALKSFANRKRRFGGN